MSNNKINKVSNEFLDRLNCNDINMEKKKLKRSYMLSKETIKKLKIIEIQKIDKTLSELVESAIDLLYKETLKEEGGN